jgi:hypothetical protein
MKLSGIMKKNLIFP